MLLGLLARAHQASAALGPIEGRAAEHDSALDEAAGKRTGESPEDKQWADAVKKALGEGVGAAPSGADAVAADVQRIYAEESAVKLRLLVDDAFGNSSLCSHCPEPSFRPPEFVVYMHRLPPGLEVVSKLRSPRKLFALTEVDGHIVLFLANPNGVVGIADLGIVDKASIRRASEIERALDAGTVRFVSTRLDETLKQYDVVLAGTRVFRGDERAGPFWTNILAAPELHAEMAKVEKQKLRQGKLRVLNLVDDAETAFRVTKQFGSKELKLTDPGLDAVEQAVRRAGKGIVLAMAHIENGEVIVGKERIAAHELEERVLATGSTLILLGCGSVQSGAGYLGDVYSDDIIDRMSTAVTKPHATVRDLWEALASAANPIQIDAVVLNAIAGISEPERTLVGYAARDVDHSDPAVSIRTTRAGATAIRINLSRLETAPPAIDGGVAAPAVSTIPDPSIVIPPDAGQGEMIGIAIVAGLAVVGAGGLYLYRRANG